MSDTNQLLLSIVTRLTSNLDKIDRVDEVLEMLEQCFLSLFKSPELQKAEATSTLKGNAKVVPLLTSASSIASTEESKLEITTAVLNFHLHARERHSHFLRSTLYHPHAALFIHELLKSLSGNSQLWFRALQIRALETCTAIVQSIGTDNVRRCLPGIISATTKYIHRAHHGKDAIRVRLCAIELLHTTLSVALTNTTQEQKDNVETMEETSSSTFMGKVSCKSNKEQQQSLEKTECVQSLCQINQNKISVKYDNHEDDNEKSNKNINITEEKKLDASTEKTWLINTIPHLHSALQSVLLASELCNNVQYDVRTLVALREFVIMLLSSSLMHEYLHTPLAGMLFASYHILTSLVQFNSLSHLSCSDTEHSQCKISVLPAELECCKDAQNALRRSLMELNGLEFLHLATSILHHTHLCSLMLTRGSAFDERHECNEADVNETQQDANERMYCKMADDIDSAVNTFLFTLLIKKCISVIKKTFTNEEYYSNVNYQFKLSQSLHCCVVNQFLISLAHALYVMSTYEPASIEISQSTDISDKITTPNYVETGSVSEDGTDSNEITNGEVLTNILFAECEAILEDWYQYDIHAAVVYILARVIIWQFSWSIHVQCHKWEKMIAQNYDVSERMRSDGNHSVNENTSLRFMLPSWFVNDGVFDELWSVIGMPHLWNILLDEELCSFEQIKHRQLMASTILRCLCLIIQFVFGTANVCTIGIDKSKNEISEGDNYENSKKINNCTNTNTNIENDNALINSYRNAFERFVTRTLYLVLEKAASVNHVHETAMSTLHAYANAEAVCESMWKMNTYSSSYLHITTTTESSKSITDCIAQETRVENANMLAQDKNNIDRNSINNNNININLHFILKYGHLIIDDALRSAKVDELQNSAASILRGVVAFFKESIQRRKNSSNSKKQGEEKNRNNKKNTCNKKVNNIIELENIDISTKQELPVNAPSQEIRSTKNNNNNNSDAPPSRLVEVVQSSLSVASIERKLSRIEKLDDHTISTMATFLSASVKVGLECCQSIWENENYAMSQRIWQTLNKGNTSSNRDKYYANEMELDQLNEEVVRSRRAALVLLCDSAHLAALLSFSTPLRPFRTFRVINVDFSSTTNGECKMANSSYHENDNEEEEEERQTTSTNVQVQGLQQELLTAIDKLLSWFSTLDRLTSYAIRAIVEMLTVFLTTTKVITEIDSANNKECMSSSYKKEGSVVVDTNTTEQEHQEHFNTEQKDSKEKITSIATDKKLSEKEKVQLDNETKLTIEQELITNTNCTLQSIVALPQSILKVVYKVYLSFTSMLKEPIAALVTNTQKLKSKWTAHEIRVLLAIPIRASLFSVLDGLHALLLLAPDFLIYRMVHEVMPLCLVWYEKVKRTRILTDTDSRLKHNIEEFAYVVHTRCYKTLQHELEQICAPYFILAKTSACHDKELTQAQA